MKCADIWGFVYKDALFRIDEQGMFGRLVSKGKVNYYENGVGHLQMLKKNSDELRFTDGPWSYFSKDFKSPMVPSPSGLGGKKYKEFFITNKHTKLYDCMNNAKSFEASRECVFDYNGEGK